MALRPDFAGAWADIVDGLRSVRIWGRLGFLDVRRRYRRTVIGPFWVTLNFAFLAGAMGLIWAPLFGADVNHYLPFVTTGIVCWSYISSLVNEGCGIYTGAENLLKQLKFPVTVLNLVNVWKNTIVFFHNLIIVFLVIVLVKVPINTYTLLVIPGLLLVALNGLWFTILLGIVSCRFRDIPPLVANIVQVLYFVTPVFWYPNQLTGPRHLIVIYNPLHHLMDMIRSPLLGQVPSLLSYEVTLGMTVLGWAATFIIFARFRRRITYWL